MNTSNIYTLRDQSGEEYAIPRDDLIEAAQACVREQFASGLVLTSTKNAAKHCQVLLAPEQQEVFYALWLNSQHEIIHHEVLSRGTIDGASVYPREVVKAGLACNAAAVIFAHNHPSGTSNPSEADKQITRRLRDALALIDIRVLDHLVVAKDVTSMAEQGLL
jgi:DNA repair protein RadC